MILLLSSVLWVQLSYAAMSVSNLPCIEIKVQPDNGVCENSHLVTVVQEATVGGYELERAFLIIRVPGSVPELFEFDEVGSDQFCISEELLSKGNLKLIYKEPDGGEHDLEINLLVPTLANVNSPSFNTCE